MLLWGFASLWLIMLRVEQLFEHQLFGPQGVLFKVLAFVIGYHFGALG